MTGDAKLYQIKKGFAQRNNYLIYFVAKPLIETQKALYLYGHGSGETTKKGICCKCGRELTHPVSVLLGIGPECGGHYHDWNYVGGYTEANLAKLRVLLYNIKIEGWFPKSQIVTIEDTTEAVIVPEDHPKLQPKIGSDCKTEIGSDCKTEIGSDCKTEIGMKPEIKTATVAKNKYGETIIRLHFPYDIDLLDKVRSLTGRRWHSEEHCWSVPLYLEAVEQLKSWGFKLDTTLEAFLQRDATTKTTINIEGIPGLKGTLFPFQKDGVAFIESNKGRALLADEMGLGKTVQALAWLQMHPECRPVLIVVPASLKINWLREIQRWITDDSVEVLSGTNPYPITKRIVIINYDILFDWMDEVNKINFDTLITDECHYYKSSKAKRTKAIKMIGKTISHVIALSGTPIVNRPIEAYNAIRLIDPTLFPSAMKFANRYCGATYNGFGWDFKGATHTEELHDRLSKTIMLRRLKKDVLKDLPDKVRSFVPMELSNNEEYRMAEAQFIRYVRETRGAVAAIKASAAVMLTKIEVLKQVAVHGKLEQAVEWINNFLEVDGKLVVFCVHRDIIDALMATFNNCAVKLDGSCTAAQRQKAVDDFQNDPTVRLFIGNIQAAGVGITLTAASNVAFLELPWTPGALVQAEDRCHRIGQKDCVNIYYLLATNTIEERIALLIDAKRKVLDSVLDGTETDEESLLMEIIKAYTA